jgi:hypothetical protein
VIAQQGQGLPAAAAEVEHRRALRQVGEIGQVRRDAFADLLLGAAIPAFELEIAVLLVRAGDPLYRGLLPIAHSGEGGAQAAEEVAGLAPVAVELLVGAGEERVVVAHDLGDALGVEGLLVLDAPQVIGAGRLQALQVLEQDEIERALPVPQVVLGNLDQGTDEALEADEQPAEKAAMAADRELVVSRPQPPPIGEIAGGLDEEVVDLGGATSRHAGSVRHRAPRTGRYSSATTATVTSAMTSGCSSTRTG